MTFDQIVKLSDQVITNFIRDWQQRPYCWLQEIDIQAELINRLCNQLPENQRSFTAKHDHEANMPNQFSRVTCEPYVKLLPARSWMHPDIVIWSDRVTTEFINSGTFPIDLICEIKYSFDEPISGEGEDHDRLSASLNSESRPQLALQLVFIQKPTSSGDPVQKMTSADGRLLVYRIYLPSTWGANAI